MCRNRLKRIYSKDKIDSREAFAIQEELAGKVVVKNGFDSISTVAGADIAILGKQKKLLCGIIVFTYPELKIIEKKWETVKEKFPYIPGLLAFREGPAIIKTYGKLENKPDILIIDGQGLAHPRKFGIACHIGVILDIPVMGIAKKRLYGEHKDISIKRGAREDLLAPDTGEVVGSVLRTRDNVKPVYVSIGNRIDLDTAVNVALACNGGYRIPEPTRQADKYVSKIKKESA